MARFCRPIGRSHTSKQISAQTSSVVDVAWYLEDPKPKWTLTVDQENAALHGITSEQAARAPPHCQVRLICAPARRSASARVDSGGCPQGPAPMRLEDIPLTAGDGVLVSLQGLAHVTQSTLEPSIYRKGMRRVVHVTSEVSEAEENPKYAIFRMNEAHDHLRLPAG